MNNYNKIQALQYLSEYQDGLEDTTPISLEVLRMNIAHTLMLSEHIPLTRDQLMRIDEIINQ